MNCDKCSDLIGEFLDGALSHEDQAKLSSHLDECLDCAGVRDDLHSIVSFCRAHRGEYTAPPDEKAMWLRIRNVIEASANPLQGAPGPARRNVWKDWVGRSWELSLPQLVAFAAVIVLVVSLSTIVALRRSQNAGPVVDRVVPEQGLSLAATNVRKRVSQQQQLISYWNQRVEYNKARWSPEMRETFERNLKVIDQTVNDQFDALSLNPHDEVSEEILNAALNEKLSLLKEFAEL